MQDYVKKRSHLIVFFDKVLLFLTFCKLSHVVSIFCCMLMLSNILRQKLLNRGKH